MKKKLTAIGIPTLPEGEYVDAHTPGLILRVGANRRTWEYRYRQGGKRYRDRIGYFPIVGLLEARQAASDRARRIDAGLPAAAAPAAMHPRSPDVLTLGALLDRYQTLRSREAGRTKTLARNMQTLRFCMKSYLAVPVGELTKRDLRACRDQIRERAPVLSNRFLGYLSPALQWASEEDLIETNVARDVRKAPERSRSRVLTMDEIKAIWLACDRVTGGQSAEPYGRLVRFLILTGQRRSEAAGLKFGHILDGTWRQLENKSSRPHSLPLPPLAMAQVGQGGDPRDHVFAGRSGKLAGFATLKAALDEKSGVSGWVLHDLRRSFATHLQDDLNIDESVIRGLLNHSLPGVSGRYLRGEFLTQKADALAAWAARIEKITARRAVS